MKKIIILLTIIITLISCTKRQEINVNETNLQENTLIEQTWNLVDTNSWAIQEEAPEIVLKDELTEITHNNFKPLIESLKTMENESLKTIDCETFIYFPELDKRPDYQVEIYNDYKKQCVEIVENAKK